MLQFRIRTLMIAVAVVPLFLWGALMASTTEGEGPFPPGTEDRLARFTDGSHPQPHPLRLRSAV